MEVDQRAIKAFYSYFRIRRSPFRIHSETFLKVMETFLSTAC